MKHLILGSSGQVGKALCKYIKEQNEEIIELDIKNSIDEDLRESENLILCDSLEKCDFVYFLAFDVGGAKYLEKYQDSYKFINNNMKIMVNTFEQLKDSGKPFMFASSPNYPTEAYGMLKKLGEKMTLDLSGIVTRFWNVYDKEEEELKAHVITDFIEMAKRDKIIKMRTTGVESRQFLHGEDASACLYEISQKYFNIRQNPYNSVIDITSFKWVTIKETADIISKQFGMIPVIPCTKIGEEQKRDNNEPSKLVLDFWTPRTSLEEGIKKLINNG